MHPERMLHEARCPEAGGSRSALEVALEVLHTLHPLAGLSEGDARRGALQDGLRELCEAEEGLAEAVLICCGEEGGLPQHVSPGSRAASVLAWLRAGGGVERSLVVGESSPGAATRWPDGLGPWLLDALDRLEVGEAGLWQAVIPSVACGVVGVSHYVGARWARTESCSLQECAELTGLSPREALEALEPALEVTCALWAADLSLGLEEAFAAGRAALQPS